MTRFSALALALVVLGAMAASAAPNLKKPLSANVDYRHVHEDVAKLLFSGDYRQAADWCDWFTRLNPTDAEGLYFLAGAQANLGQLDDAMRTVRRALLAGLPIERFIAGPRDAFAPLTGFAPFKALADQQLATEIIHGPMISDVTATSARIWIRTAGPCEVAVAAREPGSGKLITSRLEHSTRETDNTAVMHLTGLKPRTEYRYSFLFADSSLPAGVSGTFRTFGEPGKGTTLSVAIGGGSAYKPSSERVWSVMAGHDPDIFLTLGDNVYIDAPTNRAYQRYKYYRRQSRPEYRSLLAGTAVYSIWDDHDFGADDCSGGPEIDTPAWKRDVWNVYRQNWANPGYGGGERQPGCWYRFSVGDIEFFMTDSRYYRTDPKRTPAAERSMFGPAQKRWLLDALKASTATIKVLASAVPWASGTKPGSLDTWDGFPDEREEIFSTISRNKIDGVILISADRHRHDIWKIERPGSYPLYEFESSKITNQHTHKTMEKALFSVNSRGFGLFHFDTTREDPKIHYEVINENDQVEYQFDLTLSQIRH